MAINSTKLKHIVSIDRHESIGAAARALDLTQSTISRSLADVEQEIGYTLFERRARDVIATERGRAFINRASRIISDLDQLANDARQTREIGETLVRIGVSPPSMQGLINRAVATALSKNSDLRLHHEALTSGAGIRALQRGDIDMLIAPETTMRNATELNFEKLQDLETKLYARKGHPLAKRKTIRRSELVEYPVVAPDRMSWHTDRLRTLFSGMSGDPARRMHVVEYFPLVESMVANSDAISVISKPYSASKAFSTRFALLPIDFFMPLSFGVATRKKWPPTPAMRAFLQALREFPPGL